MPTSSDLTPETGRPAVAPRVRLLAVLGLCGLLVLGTAAWSLARGAADPGGHASHASPRGHGWSAAAGRPDVLGGALAAGVPSVQRTDLHDTAVTVAVGPARPGPNLVRVDALPLGAATHEGHATGHGSDHGAGADPGTVLVGTGTNPDDLVEARPVAGTEGLWARVDLPEEEGALVVSHHGRQARFPVVTGTSGSGSTSPTWATDDGPECLAAAVATTVAGEQPDAATCPGDALTGPESDMLTRTVALLGQRGVERLAVRSDDSGRSRDADTVVRRAADAAGVEVVTTAAPATGRTALLDLAGWETASEALAAEADLPREEQPIRSDGTWLAPWLLSPGVVDATPGAVLPLAFDIRDDDARRYAETLRAVLPAVAPTAAGYQAWAGVRGTTPATALLYAASRANFMSSDMGHPGHETQVGWFPGGTITPVATFDSAAPTRG